MISRFRCNRIYVLSQTLSVGHRATSRRRLNPVIWVDPVIWFPLPYLPPSLAHSRDAPNAMLAWTRRGARHRMNMASGRDAHQARTLWRQLTRPLCPWRAWWADRPAPIPCICVACRKLGKLLIMRDRFPEPWVCACTLKSSMLNMGRFCTGPWIFRLRVWVVSPPHWSLLERLQFRWGFVVHFCPFSPSIIQIMGSRADFIPTRRYQTSLAIFEGPPPPRVIRQTGWHLYSIVSVCTPHTRHIRQYLWLRPRKHDVRWQYNDILTGERSSLY